MRYKEFEINVREYELGQFRASIGLPDGHLVRPVSPADILPGRVVVTFAFPSEESALSEARRLVDAGEIVAATPK